MQMIFDKRESLYRENTKLKKLSVQIKLDGIMSERISYINVNVSIVNLNIFIYYTLVI